LLRQAGKLAATKESPRSNLHTVLTNSARGKPDLQEANRK
jgi:hypothetical protein